LDDSIYKSMHCYEHKKSRSKEHHSRKGKSKGMFDQRKKVFKPPYYKNQLKNVQHGKQPQGRYKWTIPVEGKPREPIQCWGCGENHMLNECLHRKGNQKGLHNLEESIIVEDMARETPTIYAALDNHQENQ